ncbi:bifunctional phosphopantothenoylcysteine decarboxylase/phosphopantothenate--cysteine ligase CoaBC [Polyangium sp. 6x1]|uniref:bifunctional phosphopantothenoylcysteine decarboxylase/phosphopantothenate--cysteine ligase CoaBC n=1 Tax=Polyangium sp. 6x1 TaxID=3042689 RepID=UPI00248251A0|nr:bifunctional phosphopantothenoylcysteine decarboxylase/phosphopantothenate--cysteine ligase CoaBC [Polyangium sp. 6x1]MDI1450656.1 bifunctional phosphopantothenoylcysteine decarboxylase/phosphopantothenate--cysteine ligase CoaBC [Polyangium sp. 6x1]
MSAALPSSVPPTIVLAVSGSIAAYKAVEVARLLKKAGARVIPMMTRSAREFVGAQTLAGITGEPVHEDMFDPGYPGEKHVELGRVADLVLIVPATADLIARLAAGRADDLLTALVLCARGPVLAAPAMHPRMWAHPATTRNVATLAADGRVSLIGPAFGEVASGERGMGRMAEPEEITRAALASVQARDLAGLRIVVTAGPTVEDLDPVRFLGNRSTGKMGFAIAERAAARGASVTLVAGPVTLATPQGVTRVDVRGALAMKEALWEAMGADLGRADALVMSAAVADYRPAEQSATKRKRSAEPLEIKLVPNPDLLAEVGAARTGARPVLVGFAVETADDAGIVAYARGKLQAKRVDMVVANHAQDSFGREDNRATIVTATGADALGVLSKRDLADRILDRVAERCR